MPNGSLVLVTKPAPAPSVCLSVLFSQIMYCLGMNLVQIAKKNKSQERSPCNSSARVLVATPSLELSKLYDYVNFIKKKTLKSCDEYFSWDGVALEPYSMRREETYLWFISQ